MGYYIFSAIKPKKLNVTIKQKNPYPMVYKPKAMVINLDAWLKHTSVQMIYGRTQSENKLNLKKKTTVHCKRILCSTMGA